MSSKYTLRYLTTVAVLWHNNVEISIMLQFMSSPQKCTLTDDFVVPVGTIEGTITRFFWRVVKKEPEEQKLEQKIDLFVPGRLCLFGEHSDWAGWHRVLNGELAVGRAIVTGIEQGIYATAKRAKTLCISTLDPEGNRLEFECEMKLSVLRAEASNGSYFSYACGVAAYMCEHYRVEGIDLYITQCTLPIKKGLSSSAAFCVLVARAFNQLYRLRMSTNGEMQAAYRGESLTKSRCGRLDQACAYGVRPVCITFDGDEIEVNKLKVGREFYWVFADLHAKKDTVRILADLNRCYPFVDNEIQARVHEALGEDNLRLIDEAVAAIESGDAPRLGELMVESQRNFDEKVLPACPSELTAPELHRVLQDPNITKLTYGGKGVGSQGDGSIQFLAKSKQDQKELVRYLQDALGMTAFPFTLSSKQKIRKAIVPVAGFGTRMYPATRFIKKAFVPVVDYDGYVKPSILVLLEELDQAGLEEIILVVGEGEQEIYDSVFRAELTDEHMGKLSERAQEYEKQLQSLGEKIRYVVQKERKGFGHAVYQAREFLASDEPVLLSLGDHIYHSESGVSCTEQMIALYDRTGKLSISIKEIPLKNVVHYGMVKGAFWDERQRYMTAEDMVEKPTVEYAQENLGVMGNDKRYHYYSTFGQYVLTPAVFDFLEREIKENRNNDTEIQLTTALREICRKDGMAGVLIDGHSFDVGIPEAYKRTVSEFGMRFESEDIKIWK